ncbi:MAG TPA: DUF3999 family protein, partial [Bacteroidales bacterium]
MKLKTRIATLLTIFACFSSYGQLNQYNYKREIKGIVNQWHKIVLPDDIFSKVTPGLSDIRIYGFTANHDTIEAPYLLKQTNEDVRSREVSFKTRNVSHNAKGYYFTFEIPTRETINNINLDFKQQNFDWKLKLEGSQNQQEWFTIVDDYRILSIENAQTDFQFTKVTFPISGYHFFRVCIASKEKPDLLEAKISKQEIIDGVFTNYPVRKVKTHQDKQNKRTEIDLDLGMPVPVCFVNIGVKDSFDFYRPFTIEYLADSFKTEQGWRYNYNTLANGTLNSFEKTGIKFSSTILRKLKITIHNLDNQPLTIDSFDIKGCRYELIARFTQPAVYYLAYGNSKADHPNYDIAQFTEKIPVTLASLEL